MFPDGSEHAHHLVLTDGCPRVRNGRADDPDVVLFTDLATARDLALGRTNAQRALTAGRLRVHGDVHSLLAHSEQLAALDDVFAQARSEASSSPADGNLGSTIESGESKT
jgi:putative sterol carrier protein